MHLYFFDEVYFFSFHCFPYLMSPLSAPVKAGRDARTKEDVCIGDHHVALVAEVGKPGLVLEVKGLVVEAAWTCHHPPSKG